MNRLLLAFCVFLCMGSYPLMARSVVIAISQMASHPSLDAVREGFKSALKKHGYKEGENLNIIYGNAHGDMEKSDQISRRILSASPDVVLTITTASTVSVLKAREDSSVPVVFSAVTDPVGDGLVNSMETPGEFITGTTDCPPLKKQLSLIQQVLRKKKIRLGVVYDGKSSGAQFQKSKIDKISKSYNMEVKAIQVSNKEELQAALQKLIPQVDAIYTPLDSLISMELPQIVATCLENGSGVKIPVFSSDPEGVRQGALACVGFTHFEEGVLAGHLVIKILNGARAMEIPVEKPEARDVYVNMTTAKLLGMPMPVSYDGITGDVVRFE